MPTTPLLCLALLFTGAPPLAAAPPRQDNKRFEGAKWIWGGAASAAPAAPGALDHDAVRLGTVVTLASAPAKAAAWASADNHFILFVNGKLAGHGDEWTQPTPLDLAPLLHAGANRLDALCWNDGGAVGFLFAAKLMLADGTSQNVVSDAKWHADSCEPAIARSATFFPTELSDAPARELGPYGCAPWGRLDPPKPEDHFEPLPGFRVECVADSVGSVINVGLGDHDRLFVAAEGRGVTRLSDPGKDGMYATVESYTDQVTSCQGLLSDGDALFVTGNGPQGAALYRVPEATRVPECLGRFDGGMGEHGPHAIVKGPDGWLYMAVGNHASLIEKPGADSPLSPLRYEGFLLPRYVDPRGHAVQCRAPGGVVLRVDPKSREWQFFAGGFRNHYDLTFDTSGHLFTFDSDMEWDVALPWYRAVRFVHVVPGGEYGWRTGSSVWPFWYADSLPPAAETGRGSPTGMCCYDKTQFPEHFRGAILAGDWSQGQILAFHPKPEGATFTGDVDVLLRGRPLNVTDLVVASDGSLLFSVGGRGTAGGVYRLSYSGPSHPGANSAGPNNATANKTDSNNATANATNNTNKSVSAPPTYTATTPIRELLAALGDSDRFVRYLAGRALERRDPATFESEALKLASPLARAEALVALARIGLARTDEASAQAAATHDSVVHEREWWNQLAAASGVIAAVPPKSAAAAAPGGSKAVAAAPPTAAGAADPALVTALRALELLFVNHDGAAIAARPNEFAKLTAELTPILLKHFPTGSHDADRELAQLLAFLGDPAATPKLYDAFLKEPSRVEQIWLVYCLRCCRNGMTGPMRMALARYCDRGIREWSGGASFEGYLRYLRGDLDLLMTESERAELAAEAASFARAGSAGAQPVAPNQEPRDLDAVASFVEKTRDAPRRSPAEGARLFSKSCANCHQIAGHGKSVGPELTTAAGRFRVRDLIEAIVAPSRTISDQYRATNFFVKGGDIVSGIPTLDDGKRVIVVESTGIPRELKSEEIESRRIAEKSLMPEGLIDGLTLEEISDLVAFVFAGKPVEPPSDAAPKLWTTLFEDDIAAKQAIVSAQPFADFMVEYEIKLGSPEANGGLSFRAAKSADGPLVGYRAAAGADLWGSLLEDGKRGVVQRPHSEIWQTLADLHGWNHFLVTAVGDHVTIAHNGTVTIDLTDAAGARAGLLGFDVPKLPAAPPGPNGDFAIRNVRIRVAALPPRQ